MASDQSFQTPGGNGALRLVAAGSDTKDQENGKGNPTPPTMNTPDDRESTTEAVDKPQPDQMKSEGEDTKHVFSMFSYVIHTAGLPACC